MDEGGLSRGEGEHTHRDSGDPCNLLKTLKERHAQSRLNCYVIERSYHRLRVCGL